MRTLLATAVAFLLVLFQTQTALAANLVAKVSLSSQTMVVTQNGVVKYRWRVSTGRKGYGTPTGSWSAKWVSRNHRSRKYNNAPMPFAVFFKGGYAVHATYETKRLGRPAQELLGEALDRYLDEHGPEVVPESGFDEVVFGEGDDTHRFGAAEFRQLPLRRQVSLLMGKPVYFYRNGRQIPREQAMSLRGIAKL